MRTVIITIAILGLFSTVATAADAQTSSPISGALPDTVNNNHVYIFQLKKNGISIKETAQDFCNKMDYGKAIFSKRDDDIVRTDNQQRIPGDLDWVICQWKVK